MKWKFAREVALRSDADGPPIYQSVTEFMKIIKAIDAAKYFMKQLYECEACDFVTQKMCGTCDSALHQQKLALKGLDK